MIDLLYRLTSVWGPSGREERVAEALREILVACTDSVDADRFGNLIAIRRGSPGGRRLLLAASMDTAGAVALNISEQGLIQLAPVGGLKVQHALGQRVVWGSGAVGVLQHQPVDEPKELDFKKLFCDIGAANKEEALESVRLGDVCTLVGDLQQMGDAVAGPALDSRAACAVLVQVAQHLVEPAAEVVFAFLSQSRTLQGAGVAAFGTAPDLAVVLDHSAATDMPGGGRTGVKMGAGPVLRLKDTGFMSHVALGDMVREVAGQYSIPLQTEILPSGNPSSLSQSVGAARSGVPAVVVGIPVRYRGSAAEMVNLRDLHGTADLLLKLCGSPLEL